MKNEKIIEMMKISSYRTQLVDELQTLTVIGLLRSKRAFFLGDPTNMRQPVYDIGSDMCS